MRKRYLDCILAEPEEDCRRSLKRRCNDFVIKNVPIFVYFFLCYHLPMSIKIFITVFTFLKVNAKGKFVRNILSCFLQKNADFSTFVEI